MGIQINGSTDRITAIDGTIDFVSNIGNIGLITASNYVLQDAITIGAGSTIIKTVNGKLGIGTANPTRALTIAKQDNELSGTGNNFGIYIYPKSNGYCYLDALTGSSNNTSLAIRTYNNGVYNTVIQSISGNETTFSTANTERLRITSSGQVLIGINNAVDAEVDLQIHSATSGNGPILNLTNDTGDCRIFFGQDNSSGSANAQGQIRYNVANNYLTAYTAGGERLRISSGGQVRMNTAGSPSADLHVGGTSAVLNSYFQTSSSTGAYHKYSLGDSGADLGYLGSARQISSSGQSAGFALRSQGHIEFCTGGSTERLRITSGGNIETQGLGTFEFNNGWSAEARNINVFPCDDVSNWFSFIGTNLRFTDGGNFVKPSDNSNSNWGNIAGIAFEGANQNNSSGNHPAIRFVVDQPGGNGSNYSLGSGNSGKTAAIDNNTAMCIAGNGNVGINAANPNSKLLIIDDSATQTTILKLRNYKSGVNTKPTLTFEASSSAGQGANSSIQGLAGTDAGGAANANDSGMKFIVAYGGSGTGREAFTIKKDGNVYFPAGQGIDFSATSDATGMTSELFSDYERGAHTYTVTGAGGNPTVNIQSGYNKLYYTKIGDMVHVTGEMRWTISSHGSGDIRISIPFTADSQSQSNCQGTAQTWNVDWAWRSESRDLWSEVSPGHNYMRFRIGGSDSLNEDYLDCGSSYQKTSNSNYGVEYQVSIWYRTG